MAKRNIFSQTGNWLRKHKLIRPLHSQPELGKDGLISHEDKNSKNSELIIKTVSHKDKQLDKLQEGFDKLVERLQGINDHLDKQANQHQELMDKIQQLPKILESFPEMVENQKKITEELTEQLKGTAAKNEQFVDAVDKIPNQIAKQTDALVNIDHQLAAAAEIDVQMSQSMNNFNQILDKLNDSTVKHTTGIEQMSKTFSASDRYLKYIISKQNKRFMWIFVAAISVCVATILILTGIIIYIKN
ncbi:MAG: hypothetical protein JXA96_10865 [Sedimentisphaerales bacterium]|nr:hypothetical protein [Sedimentisphaerales bacterium]